MPVLEKPKKEAFAQGMANGLSAAAAYRKVYPAAKRVTYESKGPAMARLGQVKDRITELKKKADAIMDKKAVLSIVEKREFLARLVRTPIGLVDHNSDLCQERTYIEGAEETSVRVKLPCKLKAIQLDNDLAVDGAEAGANSELANALVLIREATHGR